VKERDFAGSFAFEAESSAQAKFGFVVESLDDSAGERLFGVEVVEDEFAMRAEGVGELLEWFES